MSPSGTSPWTLQKSICGSLCGGGWGVGCAVEVQEPGTVLAGAPLLWQRGGNCWFSWQQQRHEVKPVRVEGGQPPLSDRGGLSPHEDLLSMTCVWGRGTGQRGGTLSSFRCYLQPPPSFQGFLQFIRSPTGWLQEDTLDNLLFPDLA